MKTIQNKIGLSKSNNSLPQLVSLKHTNEEEKIQFVTPKLINKQNEKMNISYESPYLQKKQEIDEIINKRYPHLSKFALEQKKNSEFYVNAFESKSQV